jgi:hypothetical protein
MTVGGLILWVSLFSGLSMAEHVELHVSKVISKGTVQIVDTESQFIILQREDGKKVSLEVTQETQIFLNGEPRGVEVLEEMKEGQTIIAAEHYTNDAGMQRVVRLDVLKLK